MPERSLLWQFRDWLRSYPESLLKLLAWGVSWLSRERRREGYRLLKSWPVLDALSAMELLSPMHADGAVREYAVRCIDEGMSNAELAQFLLQLLQVLKSEMYHDCALMRFILKRAMLDNVIGHKLFWYLKAEMHVADINERYSLLLEAYLRGCGFYQRELLTKQLQLMHRLEEVSQWVKMMVKNTKTDREVIKKELQKKLSELKFDG